MIISHNENVKRQFDLRSQTFDRSVHWVTDAGLIEAHVRAAGQPGRSLEVCCGTGAVSRGLKAAGWNAAGVDISEGMVKEARKYIEALVGDAARLPFADASFDLVVMRQAYFLLDDGPAALKEIRRVLKPGGRFILSHLVPYSSLDAPHLERVHRLKQAQLRAFHTPETLRNELSRHGFAVEREDFVTVRESVSLWMQEAPELSEAQRRQVCDLVANAPETYKDIHKVEIVNGEILENWNFVLISARPK